MVVRFQSGGGKWDCRPLFRGFSQEGNEVFAAQFAAKVAVMRSTEGCRAFGELNQLADLDQGGLVFDEPERQKGSAKGIESHPMDLFARRPRGSRVKGPVFDLRRFQSGFEGALFESEGIRRIEDHAEGSVTEERIDIVNPAFLRGNQSGDVAGVEESGQFLVDIVVVNPGCRRSG